MQVLEFESALCGNRLTNGTRRECSEPRQSCSPFAAVQREKFTLNVIGGDVNGPTVRSSRDVIKGVVVGGEPL